MKINSIKQKYTILLLFILFFAFVLRFYNLSITPNGYHADEASFYINAQSIAQTGKDEDGNSHPLSIKSLIDPKPALYSYFEIPFINTMQDQLAASRMPSILLGLLSLIVIYYLVKSLSSRKLAIIFTAILSISPWHIMMSRGTQEVIASFFFLVLSLLFVVLLQKKEYTKLKVVGFTFSSFLSMYFYHSAKVLLPLLVFGLLVYFFKKTKAIIIDSALLIFLTIAVFTASLFVQESLSRANAVGILNDKKPYALLLEQIYNLHEEIPISLTRVFYNKVQTYSVAVTNEYLKYFSPHFLFLEGGRPFRYFVPDHGLLYLIEIPLLIAGIYFAISRKRKEWPLFAAILFLGPLPAALTTIETPSIIRSFPMIIGLTYFISLTLLEVLNYKNKILKVIFILGISLVYLWQLGYFTLQYHVQAKYYQPWYRNSPYTAIAKEVALIEADYEAVEVTNDLRPLYAYFVMENLIDIQTLQENAHARNQEEYSLGKYTFNRHVCQFSEIRPGVLYIAEVGCKEKDEFNRLEVIKTIKYNDNTQVYDLLQVAK